MQDLEFLPIGRVKKSFGAEGAVRLSLEESMLEHLNDLEFLFVEIDGIKVPFEIERLESTRPVQVKFSDMDSPQAAHEITGKALFVATQDLPADIEPGFTTRSEEPFALLIDFELMDTVSGRTLGKIIRVEEYPGQDMAFVQQEEGEIMIPLAPDLIEDIDIEARRILMQLPEGLLQI